MEPTLYILMRNDLDSLNPGKACAQASHATNMFEMYCQNNIRNVLLHEHVEQWRGDRTFGRCLCVAVNDIDIQSFNHMINYEKSNTNFIGDIVTDPSYPVQDGSVIHKVEAVTCGWIFVFDPISKQDHNIISDLRGLKLYD